MSYERIFHAQPGSYQITNGGLAVIDSDLPRPTVDLRSYRHDIGAVWLWLTARAGTSAEQGRLFSERELRSHDQRPDRTEEPFAVPLEGYERNGKPSVHYPDVLLVRPDGRRVAFELELTLKSRRRLERILVGYRGEPRIDQVVYLADRKHIAEALRDTAQLTETSDVLGVQYFERPAGHRYGPQPWWPPQTLASPQVLG